MSKIFLSLEFNQGQPGALDPQAGSLTIQLWLPLSKLLMIELLKTFNCRLLLLHTSVGAAAEQFIMLDYNITKLTLTTLILFYTLAFWKWTIYALHRLYITFTPISRDKSQWWLWKGRVGGPFSWQWLVRLHSHTQMAGNHARHQPAHW